MKPGDVVLLEAEDKKRLDWPWGVVTHAYPGRDGNIRTGWVRTKTGEFFRPVQRLFMLESVLSGPQCKESQEQHVDEADIAEESEQQEQSFTKPPEPEVGQEELDQDARQQTRSGRKIKKPARFNDD